MLKWTGSQKHDARSELPNADIEPPILTVMGKDAKLEGKIETEGSIQIECEVSGEMKVRRKLVIAQSGSVRADVQTADVTIHGEYEGNMVATGSVEITPTGRVDGNLETNSIIISKGGVFNGNVAKLKESEAEEGKPPIQLVKEKRVAKEN
jgi:cytoskeletal protein CcmA (bactofilin family)